MKNKAFLPLMEQILMIAVFALAAALCLQGFATAEKTSQKIQTKDHAVIAAQITAETLKNLHGDMNAAADILPATLDGDTLTVIYNKDGNPTLTSQNEDFRLIIEKKNGELPFLEYAEIRAISADEIIFELTVGWQKGADDE